MMTCLDDAAGVAASGGTPMTQALQACGSDLADQVSDRKMLVVVTDGEPDNQFTTADELRKLRAADVEVYGIGIGVSLQKLFGKDFVTVRNVGELTNALATLFEKQVMNLPMAA
jgi:Mg-chelatase subunit ChlD